MDTVAWKFLVELPQPDGRVMPRDLLVNLPDRDAAFRALMKEHPGARGPVERGRPVDQAELDREIRANGTFIRDEIVRCVEQ